MVKEYSNLLIGAGAAFAASLAAIYLLKRTRDSAIKTCPQRGSLKNKVYLITGGSSGLGRELAVELAKLDATVVIASSNEANGEAAVKYIKEKSCKARVEWLELHLENLKSVYSFAEMFQSRYNRLDCLVNNAAVMFQPYTLTDNGIESHFAINHLAHVCLTESLLPLVSSSSPSRVVFMSSGKYKKCTMNVFNDINQPRTYSPMMAYARSKFAIILYARSLDKRLKAKKQNVSVYVVRPGFVRNTNLGRHKSKWLRACAYPLIWFFSITPHQAVQNLLYCCTATLNSGSMYNNCEICDYDRELISEENETHVERLSKLLVTASVPQLNA